MDMENKILPISQQARDKISEVISLYPKAWINPAPERPCAYSTVDRVTGSWERKGHHKGSACHSGLWGVGFSEIVVNGHKDTVQGQFPEFIKWVANEAPFSNAVLNKDNDKEIVNQGAVIDTSLVGKGGVLWLCKAFRYAFEEPDCVRHWYSLRDGGLEDGLQAFIGASIVNKEGLPRPVRTHCSLFSYDTPENIKSFYDKVLTWKNEDSREVSMINLKYAADNWGSLAFKEVSVSDGWGGFTVKKVPSDPKEYIEKLRTIFEGDYKDVK